MTLNSEKTLVMLSEGRRCGNNQTSAKRPWFVIFQKLRCSVGPWAPRGCCSSS